MVRGFYQLGSGLLAQNKVLNAIGNNISNAKTGGFKKQEVITSTFENMMVNRVDGQKTEIGGMSMARIVGDTATIHTQGTGIFICLQRVINIISHQFLVVMLLIQKAKKLRLIQINLMIYRQ